MRLPRGTRQQPSLLAKEGNHKAFLCSYFEALRAVTPYNVPTLSILSERASLTECEEPFLQTDVDGGSAASASREPATMIVPYIGVLNATSQPAEVAVDRS